MKIKFKRIFVTLTVAILLSVSAFLLWVIYMSSSSIIANNEKDFSNDEKVIQELELLIWRKKAQLEYADKHCEIDSLLPQDRPETSVITVEVNYYDTRSQIETIYNPYPQNANVFEMGIVTKSDNTSINTSGFAMRLYRIELIDEPDIYIEYVSHTEEAFFYLTKYNKEAEFLLYPLLSRYKNIIDNKSFIQVI